jgi:hypothetical protein
MELIMKFGNVVLEALFWILIIFSIAGAIIWVFKNVVNYLFVEDIKSEPQPPKDEEEE